MADVEVAPAFSDAAVVAADPAVARLVVEAAFVDDLDAAGLGAVDPVVDGLLPEPIGCVPPNVLLVVSAEPSVAHLAAT